MDASNISSKSFTEAMRGYKKEEVDEFLDDVSQEFAKLKSINSELEKKLEVLADKIREYREDEDALKEALLGAQKQGRQVVEEAKEKAKNMIDEAQEKCDNMIADAEAVVAQKNEEGEKAIADALAEKARIEEEAKQRAEELHTEMEIQNEIDKEILARTRREAEDFRTKLIIEYNNHIELIKKLPEMCQTEFVKETVDNHDTANLRELLAQQKGEEVITPVAEIPEEEENDDDVKVVSSFNEIEVQEAQSEEVEEVEEEIGGFTVENAFAEEDEEDDNTPDFLKPKHSGNKSKFEKLEFGNNTHNGNNKNKKRR
ncbi:MAG: DivIVA domain-containing protein [Ruminiclostridium sp.]|nr:DivIVA domain-containing protein [Ruminiclostridium sp.]